MERERRFARLRRRFPALSDIERSATRRIPRFACDFLLGGAGDESGVERNRAALTAVEIVPRYGVDVREIDTSVTVMGRRYAAPIGIAPIGFDGIMWPGATRLFAEAAQRHSIPYMTGTLATETIETVAALAPDVTWFQLYPLAADDHRLSFDLAARAARAGAHVLVVTLDVPSRPKKPRDLRNGFAMPFRLTPGVLAQAAIAVPWSAAILRRGIPTFANIEGYAGEGRETAAAFVGRHVGGGFTWEVLARLRDAWPGAMVAKGIMHPADAERAVALGCDGVLVSNHGGRQSDAAPAAVDMLPAVVAAVGGKASVLLDSGVTSGSGVVRALALGARTTFSGRAFMLALSGIGDDGAEHMARSLKDEVRTAMAQNGVTATDAIAGLDVRHRGAWTFADGL